MRAQALKPDAALVDDFQFVPSMITAPKIARRDNVGSAQKVSANTVLADTPDTILPRFRYKPAWGYGGSYMGPGEQAAP